jgi:zinc transport system permease protein
MMIKPDSATAMTEPLRAIALLFLLGGLLAPGLLAAQGDSPGESSIDSQLEALEREVDEKTDKHSSESADSASQEEPTDTPTATESAEPPREAESNGADTVSNWDLYRDPVLCALIAGAVLGLLGVYVVSRRIVFVSAALSQVSALGITLGFFAVGFGGLAGLAAELVPPFFAIILALVVVFALTRVDSTGSLPRDAILGTAFVVPMALVLILGPYIPQEMHEIEAILHGSAVVVRTSDLWAIGLAGALVVAGQLAAFRGFVFASLDPIVARTQGLPVDRLDAVLFGSIALMTGLVTRALGALPTFGMTVLPAIGALGLQVGLARVFLVSTVAGALSGAGGYALAYQLDWSVGASQTLVAALLMVGLRGIGRLLSATGRSSETA